MLFIQDAELESERQERGESTSHHTILSIPRVSITLRNIFSQMKVGLVAPVMSTIPYFSASRVTLIHALSEETEITDLLGARGANDDPTNDALGWWHSWTRNDLQSMQEVNHRVA